MDLQFDNVTHEHYMRQALRQAHDAARLGEVPTGCIIVHFSEDSAPGFGRIIGRAHNQTELLKDPTAHAEMIAITQAANGLGDWRLTDTVLYVTKEPCSMCAGAIVLARVPCVVFGLPDPQRGGHSVFGILNHPNLNHRPSIVSGILEDECRAVLQDFFRARRAMQGVDKSPVGPLAQSRQMEQSVRKGSGFGVQDGTVYP